MERRWISPRETAALLNIHVMTVYDWIDSGKLPAARVGRLVRIDLRALEADLEKQVRDTAIPARGKGRIR